MLDMDKLQAQALRTIAALPTLQRYFARLQGRAWVQLSGQHGDISSALLLQPVVEGLGYGGTPQQRVPFFIKLAWIVGELHSKGYLHRDLSYNNVMKAEDQPLIIDLQTLAHNSVSRIAGNRPSVHSEAGMTDAGNSCTLNDCPW